ncbi:MAG: hypothetical protein AB7O44_27385 [Hyphomicrobiaceae bacterium]
MYQPQATRRDIQIAAQRAGRIQRAQQPSTHTLPAPVGGLNGRDALDDMKAEDAVRLDNLFPGFGKVECRRGSALWGTLGADDGEFVAASAPVETLIGVRLAASTKLIAGCAGKLFDATAGGELDTPGVSGLTGNRWQHAVMNNVVGLVNGSDAPRTYNGSAWASMTVQAAEGEPSLTVASLIGINVYRSRSYFWRANDAGFWFSATNALGGDLEYFPLGDVHGVGGNLVTMITWTRDGGEAGIDDVAVFLMSSGQAVVYQGSDPGEAADWSLLGVFEIAPPLGIRCAVKIGGEALVATIDGVTALSAVLPGGRSARRVNASDNLGKFWLDQARATGSSFGWQMLHFPGLRALLVSYPAGGGQFEQFVANLATGAWCRFRGLQASCWSLFGDRLFLGGPNGQVIEANVGTSDRGASVLFEGQQAFWSPSGKARNIQAQALRPLLEATGSIEVDLSLYADYSPVPAATVHATLGAVGGGGTPWNSAKWNTFKWGAPSKVVQGWIGHAAQGYAISPAVKGQQRNDLVAWSGTTLMHSPAGIT